MAQTRRDSDMPNRVSDGSISSIFHALVANMVSAEHEDGEEPINLYDEFWVKHMDTLWNVRFEQRDLPTEDKITQINMETEENPKPIFISETLTTAEREDFVALIWEYIGIFTWSYKNMPGLDPQVTMHRLNIKKDAKLVKQQQRRFRPKLMEVIKAEVKKLIDSCFIRDE